MGRRKGMEWEHVSIQKKYPTGMHLMQCKYCNHVYVGGPHRIRAHVLGLRGQGVEKCKDASDAIKEQIRRLMAISDDEAISHVSVNANADAIMESENQSLVNANAVVTMESENLSVMNANAIAIMESENQSEIHKLCHEGASISKKIKVEIDDSLPISWEMQRRKKAEEAIARFFYAEDIPYGKVESLFFHDMVKAIGHVGPSFKAPSAYQLRKQYLNEEVASVERDLSEMKKHWKTYGCTIMSDGWSKNRRIINIFASSLHGTVFLKSIDTSGQVKTGEYVFSILKDVILAVGPSNVVQVCMDNSTNCVLAGHMIENEWPSIFYTRCTCHCLDLLLEDIAKCSWIDATFRLAFKIIVFITRRQYVSAMFRNFSGKDLLNPSTTRFSYSFIVLSSLLDGKIYGGLRRMVVSEQWCQWKGSKTKKAEEIVSIVLNASFWSDLKMIVTICKPILKLLRLVDREGATMGLIYELKDRMIKEINNMIDIDPMKLDEIKVRCMERWSMLQSPLHATGFIMHPLWIRNGPELNHELNMGWMTTVMRYASGNEALQNALLDEFYAYRKQTLDMFRLPIANDINRMKDPIKWWEIFGSCTPNLMTLAIRVLSQGASASPCEISWSTFSSIHNKRSRLNPTNVEKLVYLHTNLRLLRKIKERGFFPKEVTMEMINEEDDEERLLALQREQDGQQSEENDTLTSMIAYLGDNIEDENDVHDNDGVDFVEGN